MTTQATPQATLGLLADDCPVDAFYQQYASQYTPQPVYLEVKWDGLKVEVDWDGEIGGGVSPDVWHGRVTRYKLPCGILPDAANDLMRAVKAEIEATAVHYSEDWDGSNYVGRWSDDGEAERALGYKIEDLAHDARCLQVWDASNWFDGSAEAREYAALAVAQYDWDGAVEKIEEWLSSQPLDDLGEGPVKLERVSDYAESLVEKYTRKYENARFEPTHVVTLNGEKIAVMVDDEVPYTYVEWSKTERAETVKIDENGWRPYNDSGNWTLDVQKIEK